MKRKLISLISAFALAASLFAVPAAAAAGKSEKKDFLLAAPQKLASGQKADIKY